MGMQTLTLADSPAIGTDTVASDLARTCEQAAVPMWVEDLTGHCLHRNGLAMAEPSAESPAAFEVTDHTGRVVARLCTA